MFVLLYILKLLIFKTGSESAKSYVHFYPVWYVTPHFALHGKGACVLICVVVLAIAVSFLAYSDGWVSVGSGVCVLLYSLN